MITRGEGEVRATALGGVLEARVLFPQGRVGYFQLDLTLAIGPLTVSVESFTNGEQVRVQRTANLNLGWLR